MKALIVEDDPNLNLLWATVLGQKGHETQFCQTKSETLDYLENDDCDLIVLDLTCAEGTAMELLRAFKQNGIETAVLVITGSADYRKGALFDLSPNVRAVMRKPVDVEDMIDVAEYLGRAQSALPPHRLQTLPIELRT